MKHVPGNDPIAGTTKTELNMNDRQENFVDEYLVDANGKQAAVRAGYAPRSAEVTASRLLRNAKVSKILKQRRKEQAERLELSSDEVIERTSAGVWF